jgi:hypothetical protein
MFVPLDGGSAVPILVKPTSPPMHDPPPLTPRPEIEEQTNEGNCWDPNATLPDPLPGGPPTWLHDKAFQKLRVKLHYRNQTTTFTPCLEFCGMEGHLAKVKDGMQHRLVPLDNLVPMRPSHAQDLVTSFYTGNDTTFGKLFKIRKYDKEFCTLRGFGEKTGRAEKSFSEETIFLVEVFPPLR